MKSRRSEVKADTPINMQKLRKCVKAQLGNYTMEMKVLPDMYFYTVPKNSGYVFKISSFPLLAEHVRHRVVLDSENWGIMHDSVSFGVVAWLYPQVLLSLKRNVETLPEYKNMSDAEYCDACLLQVRELFQKSAKNFLEKYPKPNLVEV